MIEGQQFCMSKILSYMQFYNGTKAKQTLFAYLRTRTRTSRHGLLVVRQHRHGQDAMFSCTSRSKAFRKRPFQAMTFNASATNNSGLERATVVVLSEFVVEWSNYWSVNLPEMAKIRTAHQCTCVGFRWEGHKCAVKISCKKCTFIASFPDFTPQLFIAQCIKAGREPGTFRHATCVTPWRRVCGLVCGFVNPITHDVFLTVR